MGRVKVRIVNFSWGVDAEGQVSHRNGEAFFVCFLSVCSYKLQQEIFDRQRGSAQLGGCQFSSISDVVTYQYTIIWGTLNTVKNIGKHIPYFFKGKTNFTMTHSSFFLLWKGMARAYVNSNEMMVDLGLASRLV